MQKTITVTREDWIKARENIKDLVIGSSIKMEIVEDKIFEYQCNCPLAVAIQRSLELDDNITIPVSWAWFNIKSFRFQIPLDIRYRIIGKFDSDRGMTIPDYLPISFDLEIPDALC